MVGTLIMAFADYTDGTNTVSAIRWDGTDAVAAEAIYQIPGVSVHANTIGETTVKELRFSTFLTIPEGDWLLVSITANNVSAIQMTDADFTATYTLV